MESHGGQKPGCPERRKQSTSMPLGHLHDHWPEAAIQGQRGGWERGHLPKFRPGLQSLFTDEILRGTVESTLLSGPGLGA